MQITLYKKCCLNNNYQEVFYNTKLESYLNSLQKITFDLNTVYYENDGEIVIDYEFFVQESGNFSPQNIYDFNYMKVSEINGGLVLQDNLIRYCFINSIEIKNSCVYLRFKEDIWASYSSKIESSNVCVLTNSRRKYYEEGIQPGPLELPYKYDGNNTLKIKSISFPNFPLLVYVYCLVEFQLYDLSSYDEPNTDREVFYAIVKYYGQPYASTIGQLETNVRILMSNMSSGLIDNKHYQVGSIFAIPSNLLKETDFGAEENIFGSLSIKKCLNPHENVVLTGTILNNYKNLFIGVLDNYIELINNGTDIDYSVTFTCTYAGISLKLNCSNQIIDLTNSFKYDAPFQGILSEEYATRKISNDLENANLKADRNIRGSTMLESFLQGMTSLTKFNIGGGAKGIIGAFYDKPFGEWAKQGNKFEAINAPKYSNSKGVINNLSTIVNICYGLIIGEIDPDNNQFVKDFVDNYGYNCFQFLDDYWFTMVLKTDLYGENFFYYNTIKISNSNVYGSFTNEIADKLNEILEKGVKIWYVSQKADDGYTNDLLS